MSEARTKTGSAGFQACESPNRREFLRSLGRGIALGALALGGAWLVNRSGQRCFYGSACAICPAYGDCSLPEREGVAQASQPASAGDGPQAFQPASAGDGPQAFQPASAGTQARKPVVPGADGTQARKPVVPGGGR